MSEALLRIKQFHESSAAGALMRSRRILEQRTATLEAARLRCAQHATWRRQREDELFEEVREKPVHLKELETLKLQVALLRQREAALEAEVAERLREVEQGRAAVIEAERQHALAVREKEKLEVMVEVEREAQRRAGERKEELELEEFLPQGTQGEETRDD